MSRDSAVSCPNTAYRSPARVCTHERMGVAAVGGCIAAARVGACGLDETLGRRIHTTNGDAIDHNEASATPPLVGFKGVSNVSTVATTQRPATRWIPADDTPICACIATLLLARLVCSPHTPFPFPFSGPVYRLGRVCPYRTSPTPTTDRPASGRAIANPPSIHPSFPLHSFTLHPLPTPKYPASRSMTGPSSLSGAIRNCSPSRLPLLGQKGPDTGGNGSMSANNADARRMGMFVMAVLVGLAR